MTEPDEPLRQLLYIDAEVKARRNQFVLIKNKELESMEKKIISFKRVGR